MAKRNKVSFLTTRDIGNEIRCRLEKQRDEFIHPDLIFDILTEYQSMLEEQGFRYVQGYGFIFPDTYWEE